MDIYGIPVIYSVKIKLGNKEHSGLTIDELLKKYSVKLPAKII